MHRCIGVGIEWNSGTQSRSLAQERSIEIGLKANHTWLRSRPSSRGTCSHLAVRKVSSTCHPKYLPIPSSSPRSAHNMHFVHAPCVHSTQRYCLQARAPSHVHSHRRNLYTSAPIWRGKPPLLMTYSSSESPKVETDTSEPERY